MISKENRKLPGVPLALMGACTFALMAEADAARAIMTNADRQGPFPPAIGGRVQFPGPLKKLKVGDTLNRHKAGDPWRLAGDFAKSRTAKIMTAGKEAEAIGGGEG